jgi:hypothetical protein
MFLDDKVEYNLPYFHRAYISEDHQNGKVQGIVLFSNNKSINILYNQYKTDYRQNKRNESIYFKNNQHRSKKRH